jgi:hypothetical protein
VTQRNYFATDRSMASAIVFDAERLSFRKRAIDSILLATPSQIDRHP